MSAPEPKPVDYADVAMRLFRSGLDTVAIARALQVSEAKALAWVHEGRRAAK